MKVKHLIEELHKLDPNAEVILQKDSEGNGYSPLNGVDGDTVYIKENSWSGSVYNTNWSADDADMEEKEWKKILKRKRSVVLYPIN